jgi:hypothetical protein
MVNPTVAFNGTVSVLAVPTFISITYGAAVFTFAKSVESNVALEVSRLYVINADGTAGVGIFKTLADRVAAPVPVVVSDVILFV